MLVLFRESIYTAPSEPRKLGDMIGVNPSGVTSVKPIGSNHSQIRFDHDNSVYVAEPVEKAVIKLNIGLGTVK